MRCGYAKIFEKKVIIKQKRAETGSFFVLLWWDVLIFVEVSFVSEVVETYDMLEGTGGYAKF